MFGPSVARNLTMRVLTICHEKLTRSTVMERKGFDLRSLSPVLCNLWYMTSILTWMYSQKRGYLHTCMASFLLKALVSKLPSICGSHGCLREARNNIARCISAAAPISFLQWGIEERVAILQGALFWYRLVSTAGAIFIFLFFRCANSVKHFQIGWDGSQYKFGMGTFSCLSEFVEHFENKPLIGGDSGKVFTWNSALAVYFCW